MMQDLGNYALRIIAEERDCPDYQSLEAPNGSLFWNLTRSDGLNTRGITPDITLERKQEFGFDPYRANQDQAAEAMDRSRELTRLEQELDSLFVRLNDRLSFHDLLPLDERATRLREEWESLTVRQRNNDVLSADIQRLDSFQLRLSSVGVEILSNTTEAALARTRNRRAVDIVLEAARIESLNEAVALRPRPASKAAAEALEKLVFYERADGSSSNQYCVVCLEKMLRGEQVTRLPCSHMFHGDCIVEWLNQCHMCPVCRFKLPAEANSN